MFSQANESSLQANNSQLSIIIPVHNSAETLVTCLTSIQNNGGTNIELVVVDDGCTDSSSHNLSQFRAKVIRTGSRIGPARARNLGALAATGAILVFLDADVCIHTDTISRIRASFTRDPDLSALIGSYDDEPAEPGIVSQYRNLLHYYMHQKGRKTASTFWAGCGAIRANIFEEFGGFAGVYDHPSVEDIELGYRLHAKHHKILLDREIQVKHLKRWRLGKMLKTDVVRRGLPWMKLILRDKRMPNDLNLRLDQRLSVALVYLAVLFTATSATAFPAYALELRYLALVMIAFVVALNFPFYRFLARRRSSLMALASVPLHLAYFLCNGISFFVGVMMYSPALIRSAKVRRQMESGRASDSKIKTRFGTDEQSQL
jgi:glycosyltransferase involved in cell wall biosynthesis